MSANGSSPDEASPANRDGAAVPASPEGGSGPWLARRWVFLRYHWQDFSELVRRGLRSLALRGPGPTWRLVRKRFLPHRREPYPLVLYAGFDPARPTALPTAAHPRATIIVPVHNHLDVTLHCLHAIARSGDHTPFEVLVVDDASSDDSARRLPAIPGLRYLRNAENLGFIGACNAGAAAARGDMLVFLNNDTLVQPGWLDALLRTFDQHPGTGLAGSKLVYPDGRLQEAGGIVHADGQPANYGRFQDPLDPRFNFVRRVDYCSGAALAIPRALFARLGGFDAHFSPAYFEDTDLAMRVHAAGLDVRYQPASVVVHLEGVTSGTDTTRGVKAWQAANQDKFFARWAATLAEAHAVHDRADTHGFAADAAARHRYRLRVLVVDAYTPTPDRDSGSMRMVELMSLLEQAGCAVSFIPQNLAHDGARTAALQQLGVEAWWQPWIGNLSNWLRRHGPRFDAVVVSRHYVLTPLLPMLRVLAPQARVVFDTVDLHFLREEREAGQSGDPQAGRAAARTREAELALVREVDSTWVVSEVEQRLLAGLVPDADVRVVSNIHPVRDAAPGREGRAGLLFVGGFRHPPNVDAAVWMATEILPRVRERLPDLELHVAGAEAPAPVLALAQLPGVRVLGHVPDLAPLLDACIAGVAPLRYGAGIKGKVNQGLAQGLPMVATPCAVEGMFLRDGEDVLVAGDAAAFADAIVRLAGDPVLWARLQAGGFENTRRHFSRDVARSTLAPWLDGLRAGAHAGA
jgi:GT2 family glycosyltransferase/glycosyltransferase involved in cell wall biosynthesis